MTPVFRTAVLHADPKAEDAGVGNSILIDKNQGVFVTNAHIVDAWGEHKTNKLYIYLPEDKKYVQAEFNKNWINWNNDLAYLRIAPEKLKPYEQAILKPRHTRERCEAIQIVACHNDQENAEPPVVMKAGVFYWASHFGVTGPMLQKMWDTESAWFVAEEDRAALYKDYINFISFDGDLRPSMSGGAIVDMQGRVAGIISRGERSGMAIPSSDFNYAALMKESTPSPLTKLYNRLRGRTQQTDPASKPVQEPSGPQ